MEGSGAAEQLAEPAPGAFILTGASDCGKSGQALGDGIASRQMRDGLPAWFTARLLRRSC